MKTTTNGRCKQCGRGDVEFRGQNTVCTDCERLNNACRYAYLKGDNRSAAQQQLLDEAAQIYRDLADKGLTPIGLWAGVVLGKPVRRRDTLSALDYLK